MGSNIVLQPQHRLFDPEVIGPTPFGTEYPLGRHHGRD